MIANSSLVPYALAKVLTDSYEKLPYIERSRSRHA